MQNNGAGCGGGRTRGVLIISRSRIRLGHRDWSNLLKDDNVLCEKIGSRDAMLHLCPITKTCLYNFDPLKPHFYIVKLGFTEAVLTSTHNLCFEQKHEKYQNFLSTNYHFLMVKFSVYLNRRVFVMHWYGIYVLVIFSKSIETLQIRWV